MSMPQMDYAWFPGCSAASTGISYTKSTAFVADRIGMQLREIDDWCCCGTSAAHMTDEDLSYALPARSLALCEQQMPGLDVVAPCTGCYASLKRTAWKARDNEELRAHISDLIEMDYAASAEVKSLLELFVEPDMVELVASRLESTLGGMKIACYYGCTQVRPAELANFENPENPQAMERLLDACGAECVDWAFKTECCGASGHIISPEAARAACARIYANAAAAGAEAIVTSCPLCWLNLDMREAQVARAQGADWNIPVYYFTELLAAAMGADAESAGFTHHFVEATDLPTKRIAGFQATPSPAPAENTDAAQTGGQAAEPAQASGQAAESAQAFTKTTGAETAPTPANSQEVV